MKSFGWGTENALLQCDIQEMQVILCQKLEEKMKVRRTLRSVASTCSSFQGTEVETAISELFVGHYSTYVDCLSIPHTSSHKQSYMEIELDVLQCKNIYESLERFCAEEVLDWPDNYNADHYGLQVRSHSRIAVPRSNERGLPCQEARCHVRFESFPPVLQLHLKRFEFDPISDRIVKVYDTWFCFP